MRNLQNAGKEWSSADLKKIGKISRWKYSNWFDCLPIKKK